MGGHFPRAKIVVLDGPDAGGKSFLSSLLAAYFENKGLVTERIALPDLDNTVSGLNLLRPYFRHLFTSSFDPETFGLLLIANRIELINPIGSLLPKLDVLVFDRFSVSHLYQVAMARIQGSEAHRARERWHQLDKLFDAAFPVDCGFILMLSLQEAVQSAERRQQRRDATRKPVDSLERDLVLQEMVREEYELFLVQNPLWQRIEMSVPPPIGESEEWARRYLRIILEKVNRNFKKEDLLKDFSLTFRRSYDEVKFGGRFSRGDLERAFQQVHGGLKV